MPLDVRVIWIAVVLKGAHVDAVVGTQRAERILPIMTADIPNNSILSTRLICHSPVLRRVLPLQFVS